jgi:hypothetical protein
VVEGDCTGDAAVHTHARATSVGLAVIRDVELGSLKRLLPRQRVEEEKHEWQQQQVSQGHKILGLCV